MQQAGGSHFLLKRLYKIAHADEKVARQLFDKEALMTATADMAMAMSSITDADKFTTVSRCSVGSSSYPPKQRPQSCSPPHPGDDIKWINPFNDRFLTSFPPLGGHAPALPGETGNLSDLDQQKRLEELMVLASPCATLIVGAGQDGHTKNTSQGNISKDLDDAKYPSLPSSLVCPFVGDQGDLDAHIGNPVLRKPTNTVFCCGQALLSTAALSTSPSTSLVSAPLGGTHIVSAGQDRHAKNTPQGGITNDPNIAKYSSLPLPLIPPLIVSDQGDFDSHISNPALRHPTKKAFHGDQALLDTAALSGSTFASLALAPLGGLLIVGAGQDGNAKNTPRGEITNNPNNDKYTSLLLSPIPPFIGDQGDLDAYVSNPALRHPTNKAF